MGLELSGEGVDEVIVSLDVGGDLEGRKRKKQKCGRGGVPGTGSVVQREVEVGRVIEEGRSDAKVAVTATELVGQLNIVGLMAVWFARF